MTEALDPIHAGFMRRALQLALRPGHRTSPNPVVGCVVVAGGTVVGEGVTQPAGQAHAEVVALRAAGEQARGGDMYVTLEPCCHHGRTPPCTDAIIRSGVARVFVGVTDPNPLVYGVGLRLLEEAGVQAHVGLLGADCGRLIAPFRRYIVDGRPWVVLKAAVSLDGRIATHTGDSKWITGEAARREVHQLRAAADAVLVGAETALADDPQLSVRLVPGTDPLRVVLDSRLRLSPGAALLGPQAVVFHAPDADASRAEGLRATGARVVEVPRAGEGLAVAPVLRHLATLGVVTLLVEGGGRVHGSLLAARVVDEAWIYVAPRLLGRGRPALDLPSAPTVAGGWALEGVETERLGDDVRIRGLIRYPSPPGTEG